MFKEVIIGPGSGRKELECHELGEGVPNSEIRASATALK